MVNVKADTSSLVLLLAELRINHRATYTLNALLRMRKDHQVIISAAKTQRPADFSIRPR
jgi:hypothetical protein